MESSGSGAILEPLLAVEREDATGVLEFSALGIRTQVLIRNGEIIWAEAGATTETLGRLLMRRGRLTEEQVGAIIRRMTDALVDGRHVRFGEVALEYGFLEESELEGALSQQVKEKLMGCLHRGEGTWSFSKDDPRVQEASMHVVRTRPMLVEATASFPERRIEAVLELDENRFPEIVAPASVIVDEFELTRDEAGILKDLDGTASVHFVLATSIDAGPLIAALVLGRAVTLRTQPTGKRQSQEDRPVPPEFRSPRRSSAALIDGWRQSSVSDDAPTKVGDMSALASATVSRLSALEGSLPSLAERSLGSATTIAASGPLRRPSRGAMPPAAPDALEKTKSAHERLKVDLENKKRKRWPEPRDDKERRLMGEAAFHQGRTRLRAEDAERALPGLHRALELCPGEREYELYVKWAQMLVNDAFQDGTRRSEVQSLASTVVRENRDCELGFSILGHCAMDEGNEEAALRFFQRASALDPQLVEAARITQLLTSRAAEKTRRPHSKVDTGRSRLRGLLETPIDEIVPTLPPKPSVIPQSSGKSLAKMTTPGVPTPHGGIRVDGRPKVGVAGAVAKTPDSDDFTPASEVPKATTRGLAVGTLPPPPMRPGPLPEQSRPPSALPRPEALRPPPASVRPPPASLRPPPASVRPPPASVRPPPASLRPPPASLRPPPASVRPPPPAPGPLSPWRFETAVPVEVPPPVAHPPARVAPPAMPPLPPTSRPSVIDEILLERPRSRWKALLVGGVLATGAAAAAIFVVTRRAPVDDAVHPTGSTSVASASPPASTVEPPAAAPVVETPPSATAPSSSSETAESAMGVVKSKAHGRRLYVDGHIIGEGGKPYTIKCGTHRIRVGSAGVEKLVSVPCGGTIDLE